MIALAISLNAPVYAKTDAPSHAPIKDCKWSKLANESVGLAVWAQACDFGFRKVDFVFQGKSLAIRYSDGGEPEPVIDVIDLHSNESIEAGLKRFFAGHTQKTIAKRCVLAPYPGTGLPVGAKRYTFVPNASYRKALDAKANPNDVPDPPCGDWGVAPDSVQYFEAWPQSKVHKVLFVREGQDDPLFDGQTLRLIAPQGVVE
jgi:hypothetical protein